MDILSHQAYMSETQVSTIEAAFEEFTERSDIAILLINQHIAEKIRPTVDKYQKAFPALLEIPSKDHPYGAHAIYISAALANSPLLPHA